MKAERLYEGEFLRLLRRDHWEYVERGNSHGVAVIVAVTDAGKLLLVEQYRAPVAQNVIELPAGLVGDVDSAESMLDAAHRELIEETGYAADKIREVCAGPVTAGLSNEVLTFCVARDLKRVGDGGGDETENITVHEVPLAEVDAWLAAHSDAAAIDPKIHAGLRLLDAS